MMTHCLSRFYKLSPRNNALRSSFRCQISTLSWPFGSRKIEELHPYFIFGNTGDEGEIVFFQTSDCEVLSLEKKVPLELLMDARATVGASQGWVATLKERVICLQDDLNLMASDTSPKRVSLPPLVTQPDCQTQIVTNVAMSSSSPDEDDCVVAVKFMGPQFSLCRAAHDSKWTNIRITDPSFFNSPVMFSHRDQLFSLPASGGYYLGSWDLEKHRDKPKLRKLHFQNITRLIKAKKEFLDSCYRTEHLVESLNGEAFLVLCYRQKTDDLTDVETKGFRVFRLDEEGNASYTDDIGDLCIFLSKSEPFCLPASRFHDLPNNYICYVDVHDKNLEVGSFALSKGDRLLNFSHRITTKLPYYFPPQLMH